LNAANCNLIIAHTFRKFTFSAFFYFFFFFKDYKVLLLIFYAARQNIIYFIFILKDFQWLKVVEKVKEEELKEKGK